MENKRYLGDGVYAAQLGTALILTTENGVEVTNRIMLEVEVLHNLAIYLNLERRAGKPRPLTYNTGEGER